MRRALFLILVACRPDAGECDVDADCVALHPCTAGMTCERGACAGGDPAPAACGAAECGEDACGNDCGTCDDGEFCQASGVCEPGLTVIRGFVCPDAPKETVLSEVPGTGGSLVLVPIGDTCDGQLVLRGSGGDVPLSTAPSGYATAVGRAFEGGSQLVCVSDVRHHQHPDVASDPSLPDVHVTDAVVLSCAAFDGSTWTPLVPLVEPDGAWAAWTRGSITAEGPARWRVPFARDFTFQALNLTNRGRPETDGTYEIVVERTGDTLVVVEGPTRVSGQVVSQAWMTSGQWAPTEEEKASLEHIDFSDGPCPPPEGCPESPP